MEEEEEEKEEEDEQKEEEDEGEKGRRYCSLQRQLLSCMTVIVSNYLWVKFSNILMW